MTAKLHDNTKQTLSEAKNLAAEGESLKIVSEFCRRFPQNTNNDGEVTHKTHHGGYDDTAEGENVRIEGRFRTPATTHKYQSNDNGRTGQEDNYIVGTTQYGWAFSLFGIG